MNGFKTKSWSLLLTILLFNITLLQAQLIKVIDENDTVTLKKILAKPEIEKINAIDKKTNRTPLTQALKANNTLFAKMLIDKGADVSLHDGENDSPIYWAVKEGNREIAEIILNKGVDVNQKIQDYSTSLLLHVAVKNSDFDMIRLLLSHKADINAVDHYGFTPLEISMGESPYRKENKIFPNEYDSKDNYYILSTDRLSDQIPIHDTLVKYVEAMNVKLFEQDGKKYLDLLTVYEMYAPVTYLLLKSGAKVCFDNKKTTNLFVKARGSDHFYQKMLLYIYSNDCSPEYRDNLLKAAIESSLQSGDPFFVEVLLLDMVNDSVIKALNADEVFNTVLDKISKTACESNYTPDTYKSSPNYNYDPVLCHSYINALRGLFSKGLQDTSGLVMIWGNWAINNISCGPLTKEVMYELMGLSAKSGSNPNLVLDPTYFKTPLLLWLTHAYGYSRLECSLNEKNPPHYISIAATIKVIIKNGASLDPVYTGNDSHYTNNWTPLSHAIGDESEELIRLYLSNGARMDVVPVINNFINAPNNIKQILLDAGYKSE